MRPALTPEGGYVPEMMNTDAGLSEWAEPPPDDWRPTVIIESGAVAVTFYLFSALRSERIVRHTDRAARRVTMAARSGAVDAEQRIRGQHLRWLCRNKLRANHS